MSSEILVYRSLSCLLLPYFYQVKTTVISVLQDRDWKHSDYLADLKLVFQRYHTLFALSVGGVVLSILNK